jgi:NAD(P)-dependent dehydrogenase (short-subunit alcohol dehydrogenase family)
MRADFSSATIYSSMIDSILKGRSAIISGGTTGIGRAIAHALAAEEVNVLIFGRHEAELQDALASLNFAKSKVIGLTADVSLESEVDKVFARADKEFDHLDILINNAGLGGDDLEKSAWDDWKYVLDTNLLGYLGCARAAIDRMKKRGAGHIVNIGSVSAERRNAGGEM